LADSLEEEDVFDNSVDEFSEIFSSLQRVDRKYWKKKEQLRREREENQAFMSSVQEGLVSIGARGEILYFNSKFAALFVDQVQLEKMKAEGQDLILTDVIRIPEIVQAYKRVVETGAIQKITVKVFPQLSNQMHYFAVSLAPLISRSSQETISVLGVFHDISDIKKAEQIRIDFVANASHELRTPLTSVKGYVETLKGDVREKRFDQIPQFLDIVSKNVDRLIDLVNDLLSLSSLESNPQVKMERVYALQVSELVVSELNFMAAEKQIKIFIQSDISHFFADSRKVEQVLRNLISNAIKYIGTGGEIRVVWSQQESGETHLTVKDNGPGISEEHLGRLFERFYRIDRGRAREAGGTGLGLAIVKHIMQSHGGSVQVKSQMGLGCEFECTFPP
jgi:two-component system phosphate regulon sensor histidine kinase PhoR